LLAVLKRQTEITISRRILTFYRCVPAFDDAFGLCGERSEIREKGAKHAGPACCADALVASSNSYDKGTPAARPVRKAKDLTSETARPSKRKLGQ